MKFADHVVRNDTEIVLVKRTHTEMQARPEYHSNAWDMVEGGVGFDKSSLEPVNLYSVPARDVKIGEDIYKRTVAFLTYRSE